MSNTSFQKKRPICFWEYKFRVIEPTQRSRLLSYPLPISRFYYSFVKSCNKLRTLEIFTSYFVKLGFLSLQDF